MGWAASNVNGHALNSRKQKGKVVRILIKTWNANARFANVSVWLFILDQKKKIATQAKEDILRKLGTKSQLKIDGFVGFKHVITDLAKKH